jgi:nucleoid-associated protein YgaU
VIAQGAHLSPETLATLRQALVGACASSLLILCVTGVARARIRVRIPKPPAAIAAGLSALGATLALSTPPSGAEPRAGAGAGPLPREARPPWHRGSGLPPPRPLAAGRDVERHPHPALHARRRPGVPARRLFPRLRSADAPRPHRCIPRRKTYTVVPGDTLWGIAAELLDTDDLRRVAAYWPLLHRENRDRISDPNLIYPGQVLRVPTERPRRSDACPD